MIFIWPELDGSRKYLEKPIGSKLCGMKRGKLRPACVVVSQSEIESYHDWDNYRDYLEKSLRLNTDLYEVF